jgi:hypothetical protein
MEGNKQMPTRKSQPEIALMNEVERIDATIDLLLYERNRLDAKVEVLTSTRHSIYEHVKEMETNRKTKAT